MPLTPYLRLLRVGMLFSPAADVIAGACLVGKPLFSLGGVERGVLLQGAAASVCLYAAGMVLNDHADRETDRKHRPERPIPSGQIGAVTALVLGMSLLAAGIVLAPWTAYWAAIAALIVCYNYGAKRLPAAAALNMGALRGMNLLAGCVALSTPLQRWPTEQYAWIAMAVYAVYIVAVTVLGGYEDDRTVSPRAVVSVQSIPPLFAPMALLALPQPVPAAWVGFGCALALALRARRIGSAWDQAAIRGSMFWLLLGTMVYTALLALGCGAWRESLLVLATVPIARWIGRRVSSLT